MENSGDDAEEGQGQSENQAELLKSYLAFAKQAVAHHRKLAGLLFTSGLALTVLAYAYVPRTYACTTVLMAISNPVLEQTTGYYNPLAGAQGYIVRNENLEAMIHDLNLVEKAAERNPPIVKLKSTLSNAILGPASEKLKISMLLGTLKNKIMVFGDGPTLTIEADWNDPVTAAAIAGSAQESFLKARHNAEVSAFEEKVAILDEHASRLREEIEQLAGQINTQTERALAQPNATPNATPNAATPAAPRVVSQARAAPRSDEELPLLKEKLDASKKKLADLEAEQARRVREEQAKLAELKLRLTPQHPQVVTEQERVELVSQPSPDLILLRSEVTDMSAQLKQRESLSARILGEAGGGRPTSTAAAAGAEPLPAGVVQALQKGDTDPALAEQLTGAVTRYGTLRDDIRSGRIALDTAQAAFNHHYEVIVPVEQPNKPKSPKSVVIWGAGLMVSLLLALLVPILSELRKGMLLARWQVEQLQLPILAELHLPPSSSD